MRGGALSGAGKSREWQPLSMLKIGNVELGCECGILELPIVYAAPGNTVSIPGTRSTLALPALTIAAEGQGRENE